MKRILSPITITAAVARAGPRRGRWSVRGVGRGSAEIDPGPLRAARRRAHEAARGLQGRAAEGERLPPRPGQAPGDREADPRRGGKGRKAAGKSRGPNPQPAREAAPLTPNA